MASLSQIRELRIKAIQEGVAETTKALRDLSVAQDNVAAAGDRMGAATEQTGKSFVSSQAQLDRYLSKIDASYKAMATYEREVSQLNSLAKRNGLDQQSYADALTLVQARYMANVQAAERQNNMLRLNGQAARQTSLDYRQLSYQVNDVVTMFAYGASAQAIFASQSGQIFQVFQGANGGVWGGVKELGNSIASVVGRFPLLTAGIAASTVAIGLFYAATRNGMPTAEEALKRHLELIKEIKEQYRASGAELERMNTSSPSGVLAAYATRNEVVLRARYREEAKSLVNQYRVQSGVGRANDTANNSVLAEPLEALRASIRDGKPDVLEFQRAVSAIYLNPQVPENVRNLAFQMLQASESASKLAVLLPQADRAIDAASRHADVLASKMAAFPAALRALTDAGSVGLTPYDQIFKQTQAALAQSTSRDDRDDVMAARARALEEIGRQLEITRQQDELSAKAIMARTAAEKADIAAMQARLQAEKQYGAAGLDMPQTKQAEAAARAGVLAQANASARSTLEAAQRSSGQVGLSGLPAQIAQINAKYAEMIRDAGGAADAVRQLEQAQQLEIETATRSAQLAPLRQAQINSDAQRRALAVQAASFGQDAGTIGYLNEKLRLYNEFAAQGVTVTEQMTAAIEAQAREAGRNAAAQDKMAKAQQDAIASLDGFRSATKSAIGSAIEGDWESVLSSFQNFFIDNFSNQLTRGLLGRNGEAGGGLFGDMVGSLLGGGQRGDSPNNAVYVTFGADGGGVLGGLLGQNNKGSADSVWNSVFPTAANSNKFGVVGGTDALSIAREAIAQVESGGRYGALGPVTKSGDRAYGRYQVMGANIPSWTNSALGYSMNPQQFLANPGAQDAVFNKIFGGYMSKYGNTNDAASMWFSGRPLAQGAGLADSLGTTDSAYVNKFNAALGTATTGLEGFASAAKQGGAGTAGVLGGRTQGSGPLDLGALGGMGSTANWADQQLSGIEGAFSQLTTGLGNLVNSFVPGFGSVLSMLLNGLSSLGGAGGGGGGLFSLLGGLFGGGGWALSGQGSAFGLYANGGVPPGGISAYSNSIVSKPTLFAFASGAGLMGEAGPEAIMPLQRDSRGRLGVSLAGNDNGSSNGGTSVVIHNYANATVQHETTQDNRGRRQEKFIISDAIGDAMNTAGGGADRTMRQRYGIRRGGIRR